MKRLVCKTVIDGKDKYYGNCPVEGDILTDLIGAHIFREENETDYFVKEKLGAYDIEGDVEYDELTWTVEEVEIKARNDRRIH